MEAETKSIGGAYSESMRKALVDGAAAGMRHRLVIPRESMRGHAGMRLGAAAGSSLDFHDYREYQPGDDLRHLDWSAYARSDREIVKLFREEVSPKLEIVLDASSSMSLSGTAKAEAALGLAAALAAAAGNAQCEHSLWLAGDRTRMLEGSSREPQTWPVPALDSASPPDEGIMREPPRLRRNSIRIFISDLLWPSAPDGILRRLADGAASLAIIQLLAQEEEMPEIRGQHRLVDVESGDTLDIFIDETARAAYAVSLAAHRETWSRACRRCGAAFVPLTAESLFEHGRIPALERAGILEGA